MQKITTFLWFDKEAEEAAKFYVSIFKNSKILTMSKYNDEAAKASGMPKDSVMVISFELEGQQFSALNGGPMFKFNESISLAVNCKDQEEVDHLWKKLTEGGEESMCGWLKDKYGLSWQIVPSGLVELLSGKDPEKSNRASHALMQMRKIDINVLRTAYDGK
jgi:predicted 3-demethylubiquinone-9 3-methyltransferase (glyoxalase superfamily)